MRRTKQDFSDQEKALMFEHIIDILLSVYGKDVPKDFKSHAELFGYKALVALNDNGFVTPEGILGK